MTSSISENNKRIAKNALMLYIRMLFNMAVSLYTVRIVLQTLGTVDYGLYSVVGGVVAMFTFLSGTMASASQRFFAFELGRGNEEQLKKTFSMTMTIYIIIGIIVLLLAETAGLWFVYNKMTIPENRMNAALWVYQFSILAFMMTMFTIPYDAAIIAHEKMNVYAWVSIIQTSLNLLIVYLLVLFSFDKLKLYAVLMFFVTTIVTFIYRTYSKRKFQECHYSFYWDKKLFTSIVSFSGWNMLGTISNVLRNQGINILLNIFFNPAINAARGIAFQINTALTNFTTNFYIAVKPQITKSYSSGKIDEMHNLVYKSSKFAFYLMLFLSIPLLVETKFILSIWLKNVPEYTVLFSKLVIINSLIEVINLPIVTAIQATGRIKKYQTVVSVIFLMNLPISFILLKLGYPPQVTMYVSIFLSLASFVSRLLIMQQETSIPALIFVKQVFVRISIVSILSLIIPSIVYFYMNEGKTRFLLILAADIIFSSTFIYIVGLTVNERNFIKKMIIEKYENYSKKNKK